MNGRHVTVVSDDRPGDGRAGGLPRLAEGHTAGGVRQRFYLCATPPRLVNNWNLKILSTAQSPPDETLRYAAYSKYWLTRVQLELSDNLFPVFHTNEVGSVGLPWLAEDRLLEVLDNTFTCVPHYRGRQLRTTLMRFGKVDEGHTA